ncbi:MAG: DUF1566 domain-containing protein [Patescibacteria group bacterium]|nr:DUF1566 domain-containing protein [Patescibacteria group bacterium]
MRALKKSTARRRSPTRLTLAQRVSRLEAQFVSGTIVAPAAPNQASRFTNLGVDGKPTTGDHVAVHDSKTGLIWAAEPLQKGKKMNHADAMKACSSLKLMGQSDWRAPTIEELLSIVDYTRSDPAVNTDHFKGPHGWTWSSTVAAAPAGYAWLVSLNGGFSGRGNQDFHSHVRAVRAGQSLSLGL